METKVQYHNKVSDASVLTPWDMFSSYNFKLWGVKARYPAVSLYFISLKVMLQILANLDKILSGHFRTDAENVSKCSLKHSNNLEK